MGIVPDLGDDRPCSNCGYNLRGLEFESACPECGASNGINPDVEEIPWNDKRTVASYLRTVLMVLVTPNELGGHVWRMDMLWLRSARRFRGISILLATISVTAAIVSMQAIVIGLERALYCIPIDAAAVLWWFIALTAQPAKFLADKGNPVAVLRAGVLSAYLAAPLALSPLHLGIIALQYGMQLQPPFIAGLHVLLIAVQLVLMASAESAVLWQLVELPRQAAFAVCLVQSILRSLGGVVYVVLVPAFMGAVVNSIFGR